MLIVFGGQLTHVIQKNITCLWLLDWDGHNIKIIFFIPVALMGFDPVLFLYVIKLRFSINFGFIPNILENYRPQLNILSLHLITEFIIQAMINIWIRTLDQHLSFGIECLALFNQRKRNQWHYYPINSYPITLNFHIWKTLSQM
jgi:hypothetical protein